MEPPQHPRRTQRRRHPPRLARHRRRSSTSHGRRRPNHHQPHESHRTRPLVEHPSDDTDPRGTTCGGPSPPCTGHRRPRCPTRPQSPKRLLHNHDTSMSESSSAGVPPLTVGERLASLVVGGDAPELMGEDMGGHRWGQVWGNVNRALASRVTPARARGGGMGPVGPTRAPTSSGSETRKDMRNASLASGRSYPAMPAAAEEGLALTMVAASTRLPAPGRLPVSRTQWSVTMWSGLAACTTRRPRGNWARWNTLGAGG